MADLKPGMYKFANEGYLAISRAKAEHGSAKKRDLKGSDKEEFRITKIENDWGYNQPKSEWIPIIDQGNLQVFTRIRNLDPVTEKGPTGKPATIENDTGVNSDDKNEDKKEFMDENTLNEDLLLFSEDEIESSIENNFRISNLNGIFGMPYQFLPSVDSRLSDESGAIGRKYANEIVSNLPLLLITPGKPVFLSEFSEDSKKSFIKKFIYRGLGDDHSASMMDILGSGTGKYYSLEYAFKEYYEYVNPMCRLAAVYLEIGDITLPGDKLMLSLKDWGSETNDSFNKLFSVYNGCTAWYCDSETSISDSFSNGTTESQFFTGINNLSEYGRELNFLLGTVKHETGWEFDNAINSDSLPGNIETIDNTANKLLGQGKISNLFKTIAGSASTLAAGGKLVFPEMWSDSNFSRSYDINLKLVSPDADKLSIYLNIIVPLLHLLGLVLPREGVKHHGYITPFLVRAFYKGLFNVDMGIITSLSFTKGKEAAWTAEGIPTFVDVNFSIKDLYNDMYMSRLDDVKLKMTLNNNIILLDFIGNLCGININQTDIQRTLNIAGITIANKFLDTWRVSFKRKIEQSIVNKYQRIMGGFGR